MRVLFGHNKDQGGHLLVGHGLVAETGSTPTNAIRDRAGNAVLDRSGNTIVTRA